MSLDSAPLPKPFTRGFSVPPGLPWDQARAAQLEARHTSPVAALAGDELRIHVKRLTPWRPGEEGRFAAIYLKASETRPGQVFRLEVQGHPVTLEIPSPALKAAQLQQNLWIMGCVGILVVALLFMVMTSLSRRQDMDSQVTTLESDIATRLHRGAAIERAKAEAEALQALDLKGHSASEVLGALRIVTLAKNPNARIDSFLWDRGYWAIEAHGTDTPLELGSVSLKRSPKPLRGDTYLWVAQLQAPIQTGGQDAPH